MRLSNAFEETEYTYGSYLEEYDRDENSGVRNKEEMQRFLKFAMQKLTPIQASIYTRFYGEKKTVKEIAAENGIKPTTVYKHLNLARSHIVALKELAAYFTGKKSLLTEYLSVQEQLSDKFKEIAQDYYVKLLTKKQIAEAHNLTISRVNSAISEIKIFFLMHGLTTTDLQAVRHLFSTRRRSI